MKKGVALLLSGLILSVFLIGAVAAADDVGTLAGTSIKEKFITPLSNFVSALFGTSSSTFTIQKVFLAVLLFMIIYSIISLMFKGTVAWIISGVISALSIMFLTNELIDAIAIQYGAMGAAILTIIPLLIMLFFTVRIKNSLAARVLWIFYAVYYFFLYIAGITTDKFSTSASWYYVASILIGVAMVVLIKSLRNLVFKGELSAAEEQAINDINFRETGRKVSKAEARSILFPKE